MDCENNSGRQGDPVGDPEAEKQKVEQDGIEEMQKGVGKMKAIGVQPPQGIIQRVGEYVEGRIIGSGKM